MACHRAAEDNRRTEEEVLRFQKIILVQEFKIYFRRALPAEALS
jgi:hypothetical protein